MAPNTRDEHPATTRPTSPTGPTHPPAPPGQRVRRTPPEDQRRPYLNAPTLTRASRPRTRTTSTTSRGRTRPASPIPASVWAGGPDPIDPTLVWPIPIIRTIVDSFSTPGARVVLLPWPTLTHEFDRAVSSGTVGSGGVIDHAPDTLPGGELAAAVDAVEQLDRAAAVIQLPAHTPGGSGSRPFWADLVSNPDSHTATAAGDQIRGARDARDDAVVADGAGLDGVTGSADLIITSLPVDPTAPEDGDRFRDHVALAAARLLRVGGILTVLTHSDWSRGVLIDPTGPIVAAAQNADLLYLQHIVALHTPIRDGQMIIDPRAAGEAEHGLAEQPPAADTPPGSHRRAASDVLVFAQPHDHQFPATLARDRRQEPRHHPMTHPGSHRAAFPLAVIQEGTAMSASRSRPTPDTATPATDADRAADTSASPEPALSVWATAQSTPVAQRKNRYTPESTAHPAKMLPAIAAHAITHYTQPGDLVLDPMCGIGTTLVEAVHLGRRAVGIEYEPHWVGVARANLDLARTAGLNPDAAVFEGDARHLTSLLPPDLIGQAALVVTSPPYGPSTHGQVRTGTDTSSGGVHKYHHLYGNTLDRGNLANIGHHRLLAGFTRILAGTAALLRPGGHVVITIRPWREHAELIDLPSQILACGIHAGLIPVERCVALLARVADNGLVARGSFFQRDFIRKQRDAGLPLHLIAHEDVLIFSRPAFSLAFQRTQGFSPRTQGYIVVASSRDPLGW